MECCENKKSRNYRQPDLKNAGPKIWSVESSMAKAGRNHVEESGICKDFRDHYFFMETSRWHACRQVHLMSAWGQFHLFMSAIARHSSGVVEHFITSSLYSLMITSGIKRDMVLCCTLHPYDIEWCLVPEARCRRVRAILCRGRGHLCIWYNA